ncbi:hypothetical protein LVD15_11970 [Fulvivirga maritima]|uniref:hypothetical protein n=1 Tax=Fulvivirga maritima TaxID=2904247 RepID=UPI001F227B53|nr:hypothetical protein [Fulvivirga maritima]UII29112.1 hypothetical protein LVD15_11970 [Fulvivirga maritima]
MKYLRIFLFAVASLILLSITSCSDPYDDIQKELNTDPPGGNGEDIREGYDD